MIPESMIMKCLDLLLTSSEPGAALHHLHVVSATAGAAGPPGVPDESQLHNTVYAIAPTQDVNAEDFIAKVITAAAIDAHDRNLVPLFAAISQEAWTLHPDMRDEEGLRMASEGRLHAHPHAVEVTIVYGAASDGRRWRGRRWLTGPRAGVSEDVDLLVGRPHPHEALGITCAPLLRRLVGTP